MWDVCVSVYVGCVGCVCVFFFFFNFETRSCLVAEAILEPNENIHCWLLDSGFHTLQSQWYFPTLHSNLRARSY